MSLSAYAIESMAYMTSSMIDLGENDCSIEAAMCKVKQRPANFLVTFLLHLEHKCQSVFCVNYLILTRGPSSNPILLTQNISLPLLKN